MTQSRSHIPLREQLLAEIQNFNLISDLFMRVALNDVPACQYVLRILTGIQDLQVKEIRTQYEISKLTSHDARLDVFAEDSNGKLYDIEIQRSDAIDHARRTRFYGAMIDSSYLEKGTTYSELPEVHIIYLSETDLWRKGKTCYKVKKLFEGTDISYDDGIHIMYVNAAVNDGSEIARMMQYFTHTDPHDETHGELSQRVHFLKCEEGGQDKMCEVSEKIWQMGRESGVEQGIEKGIEKGIEQGRDAEKVQTAQRLLQAGSFTPEQIAQFADLPLAVVQKLIKETAK